jgi:pilus assembly protein CpaB
MLTREVGDDSDSLVTDTILQNVTILGIDQLTDEQREKPQPGRTATVEVLPDEAQKLALAMQIGTLSLALRNSGQTEVAKSRRVAIGDLVTTEPKAAMPVAPAAPAVRVRRGAAEPSTQTVRGG